MTSGIDCIIKRYIGGGGQGEVYEVELDGKPMALKWYYPETAKPEQKKSLEAIISFGPPNEKFLWPIELATASNNSDFGYIMPLREKRFKSIMDLMKRRIEPTFRALATAGIELTHAFLQLHSKGNCYRDISFGNVFFDPDNGEIVICDNDNVGIDNQTSANVLGTPRFMAPEIVRGEAKPSTQTDLYSLAALLFYMLMIAHPLDGKKECEIKCLDTPAMNKLYGTEPVFIFDPNDDSNRPVPGYHDNAIIFWSIYPQFLKDLFIKSFTSGIKDPQNGRVRESEWRLNMVKLRDSIIYCQNCGAENFYDENMLKTNGKLNPCWQCQKDIVLPPRIRIEKNIIILNHDTKLYPHHIDNSKMYDFSQPVAELSRHPQNPNIWGIKNLSDEKWVSTTKDGSMRDVEPGKSVLLQIGTKINFGKKEGEIRL
ncbi:MAG: serine/threonine protein kinase [Candidatus Atribacteria bacterium]|nr:serine/threonine protein kinase [Candidatus Atribacteria bacterium]